MRLTEIQINHILTGYLDLVAKPVSDTEKNQAKEAAYVFLSAYEFQMTNRLAWYNSLVEFTSALSVLIQMKTNDTDLYDYTEVQAYLAKYIVPNFSATENTPTFSSVYEDNTSRDLLYMSINESSKNIGMLQDLTSHRENGTSLGKGIEEATMTDSLINSVEEVALQSGIPVSYEAGTLNNTQKAVQKGTLFYSDYKGSNPTELTSESKGSAPVSNTLDKSLYTTFNTTSGPLIVQTNSIEPAQNVNDIKQLSEDLKDLTTSSIIKNDTGVVENATEDTWVNSESSGNNETKEATPTSDTSNSYTQNNVLSVQELTKADSSTSFESLSQTYSYSNSQVPSIKNWGLHIVADHYKDSADRGLPTEVYILQRPTSLRSLGVSGNWTQETFQGGQFPHSYYEKHDTANEISISVNLHQQEYPDQPLTEIVQILQDFTRPYEYSNTSLEPKPVTMFTMGQTFTGYLKSVAATYDGDDYTLWNDGDIDVNPSNSDYQYGFSSASLDLTFIVIKQVTLRQVPDLVADELDLSGYTKGEQLEDGTYQALDKDGNIVGYYDAQGNLHLTSVETQKAEEERRNELIQDITKNLAFDKDLVGFCNNSLDSMKMSQYYDLETWASRFERRYTDMKETLKSRDFLASFVSLAEEFIAWNPKRNISGDWKQLELDPDGYLNKTLAVMFASRIHENKTWAQAIEYGDADYGIVVSMINKLRQYYRALYNRYIGSDVRTEEDKAFEDITGVSAEQFDEVKFSSDISGETDLETKERGGMVRNAEAVKEGIEFHNIINGVITALKNYSTIEAYEGTRNIALKIKQIYEDIHDYDFQFYYKSYKLTNADAETPIYGEEVEDEHDTNFGRDLEDYFSVSYKTMSFKSINNVMISSSAFKLYINDDKKYDVHVNLAKMYLSHYDSKDTKNLPKKAYWVTQVPTTNEIATKESKYEEVSRVEFGDLKLPMYLNCFWYTTFSKKEELKQIIDLYNEAVKIIKNAASNLAEQNTLNSTIRSQREGVSKFNSFYKYIRDYYNALMVNTNNSTQLSDEFIVYARQFMESMPSETFALKFNVGTVTKYKVSSSGDKQAIAVADNVSLSTTDVEKYAKEFEKYTNPVELLVENASNYNIYMYIQNYWETYSSRVCEIIVKFYNKAKEINTTTSKLNGTVSTDEENPWTLLTAEFPSLKTWVVPDAYKTT